MLYSPRWIHTGHSMLYSPLCERHHGQVTAAGRLTSEDLVRVQPWGASWEHGCWCCAVCVALRSADLLCLRDRKPTTQVSLLAWQQQQSNDNKNLKQEWLLAFWNKIQTYKRLKKNAIFFRTKHDLRIFGVIKPPPPPPPPPHPPPPPPTPPSPHFFFFFFFFKATKQNLNNR